MNRRESRLLASSAHSSSLAVRLARSSCCLRFFGIIFCALSFCYLRSLTVVAAEPVPWWRDIAELHAPNPGGVGSWDGFGFSLAMDGEFAAVAMSGSIGNLGPSRAVFVYRITTGELVQTLAPTAPDSPQNFLFGYSVAISGNLVVVGVPTDAAADVFDLTTGQRVARLTANDPIDGRNFGGCVAIEGSNVVVSGAFSRAAYLFDAMSGQKLAKFSASAPLDSFSEGLALNDKIALIGASSSSDGYIGSVYAFDLATKKEIRRIVPSDGAAGDSFGTDIDLDGNNAVVGSVYHSGTSPVSGAAYVYDVDTGQQLAELLPPIVPTNGNRPNFGQAVAIDGNIAVIGAPQMLGTFVFDWTSETPLARLVPKVLPTGSFGLDVATSQGLAYVQEHSQEHSGNHGTVYVFQIPEPSTYLMATVGIVGYAFRASRGVVYRTA